MKRVPLVVWLLLSVVGFLSGCVSLTWLPVQDGVSWLSHKAHKTKLIVADEQHPVERIICIWQPGEGRGLDNLPTRGFVGQIFFFNHEFATPIIGNGSVQVFLFDDQGTPEEQVKPLHIFDFTAEAWNRLLVETQLGPAYNLFIPYVRKTPNEAECALVVKLTPEQGQPVISDMAYIRLPGIKAHRQLASKQENGKSSQTQNSSTATDTKGNNVETETIRPSFILAKKLAAQRSSFVRQHARQRTR